MRKERRFRFAILVALASTLCACLSDESGSSGNGSITLPTPTPTPFPTKVAMGHGFTCFALSNEKIKCVGNNLLGQFGTGASDSTASYFQTVSGLANVSSIVAGYYHVCALKDDKVYCWGKNEAGQLGSTSTATCSGWACTLAPTLVQGLGSGISMITAGGEHTCAVVNSSAWCWGSNDKGQLGDNGASGTSSIVPVQVSGLTSGVTQISAGNVSTCAIVSGAAKCWGSNSSGQLGDGNGGNGVLSQIPTQVSGLTSGVDEIVVGGLFSCALVSGAVKCWGYNATGELGGASTATCGGFGCNKTPLTVSGLSSVFQVRVGEGNLCAVVGTAVKCWGSNGDGAVGIGSSASFVTSPTEILSAESAINGLSLGSGHGCAIKDGWPYCWGKNTSGELGTGNTINKTSPAWVLNLTN